MLHYLDTARIGQMCPAAQAADRDFAYLAGEEGCSLYFEEFLWGGWTALAPRIRERYPGLYDWSGVTALKQDLKTLLALPRGREVLLANRSAQLVRLAVRLLCTRCQNILVTDMLWPAYLRILQAECRRTGRAITIAPVREAILRDRITNDELIDSLVSCYRGQDCDGLLLSAVTSEGVRIPVRDVCQGIGWTNRPRFVVVDGAQALNHTPLALYTEYCDFLLAGCHKWLQAYHPMGLGFCCRASSESVVTATCQDMLDQYELDDPLLRFTEQLESGTPDSFSETVNLAPMFTATAAVNQAICSRQSKRVEFAIRVENADRLAEQAPHTGWLPLRPHWPLRTGTLLLEARHSGTKSASVDALRTAFRSVGVALTAYDGGIVRASFPQRPMQPDEFSRLCSVFRHCA